MNVQSKETDRERVACCLIAIGEISAIVHSFTPQEFSSAMNAPGLIPEYREWAAAVYSLADSIHRKGRSER